MAHYNESYTYLNVSPFRYQHYEINQNTGIMMNVKGISGAFQKQSMAKQSLANAFDIARSYMNNELKQTYFRNQGEMNSKFIEFLNIGLSYQFFSPSKATTSRFKGNIPTSEVELKWYPIIY